MLVCKELRISHDAESVGTLFLHFRHQRHSSSSSSRSSSSHNSHSSSSSSSSSYSSSSSVRQQQQAYSSSSNVRQGKAYSSGLGAWVKRDYTPKSANRGDVDACIGVCGPRRCNFQHTPVLKLACADLRGMKRSLKQVPRVPEQTPKRAAEAAEGPLQGDLLRRVQAEGWPINLATWVNTRLQTQNPPTAISGSATAPAHLPQETVVPPARCTCKVQRDLGKNGVPRSSCMPAPTTPRYCKHVAPAPEARASNGPRCPWVRKARRRRNSARTSAAAFELQHVVPVPERAPNIRQKQQRRLCEELPGQLQAPAAPARPRPCPSAGVTAPASLMTKVIKRGQLMNQQSSKEFAPSPR